MTCNGFQRVASKRASWFAREQAPLFGEYARPHAIAMPSKGYNESRGAGYSRANIPAPMFLRVSNSRFTHVLGRRFIDVAMFARFFMTSE